MAYSPRKPFTVWWRLLTPSYERVKGVDVKRWDEPDGGWPGFFGSFATYTGSDREVDGVTVAVDTGYVECWYDPAILPGCRLMDEDGKLYDVVGVPEDIERRHRHMKMRVEGVRGGA